MASASITWNPRLQQWEMERNGVIIVVPEAVYERHLSAYLKSKRLKRQKWAEVMREAVNKWRRLQAEELAFRTNIDYWLTCDDENVMIRERHPRIDHGTSFITSTRPSIHPGDPENTAD